MPSAAAPSNSYIDHVRDGRDKKVHAEMRTMPIIHAGRSPHSIINITIWWFVVADEMWEAVEGWFRLRQLAFCLCQRWRF